MRESVVHQVTAQSTGSSEADQGELRSSGAKATETQYMNGARTGAVLFMIQFA